MREIKFRAWDSKNKKYFRELNFLYFGQGGIRFMWVEPEHDEMVVTELPDSDYTLLQFTGLLDKNGKEIYEGDIVKSDKWLWSPCWIDYKAPQFVRKYYRDIGGEELDTFYKPLEGSGWEVIGNIYENPELLKKEGGNNVGSV